MISLEIGYTFILNCFTYKGVDISLLLFQLLQNFLCIFLGTFNFCNFIYMTVWLVFNS